MSNAAHRHPARIAVLGTGVIGKAVARNLARKGFEVHAWNRTTEKARRLVPDRVNVHDEVSEAVRDADLIVTSLKDGPAVADAIATAQPSLRRGAVWLQISTVGVQAVATLSALAERHGLVFYDAPVQGTRQPAEQGKLVILAAGAESHRHAAQPVFDAIGQRTIWVSERPGDGTRLKLALNAYVFALTHGAAETLAIARALGVDPALVIETVAGGPLDSAYFQAKAAAMLGGDYTVSFSIENGAKDAQLVVDAISPAGIQTELATAGLKRFRRAIEAGHGDKDIAATFLA